MRNGVSKTVNLTPESDLQPVTAAFANVPASHNGWRSFTLNVEFSEKVWFSTACRTRC